MEKNLFNYKSLLSNLLNNFGTKTLSFLFILFLASGTLFGQEGATKEKPKPIRSRMSISIVQGETEGIQLNALLRAKLDKSYTGLPGLKVTFTMAVDSLEKDLGEAVTNKKGIAEFILPLEEVYVDSTDAMHFMVTFNGNDKFKGSSDDGTYTLAKITVEPTEEDSIKAMYITLESRGEPVAEEDIYLFVESYINPLPIGEGTTDEEGRVSFVFPSDLPGDPEGNVNIFAKLDDHEEFGTVVSRFTKDWGIPVAKRAENLPRALWSPYPPLWLLISFIAILVFIWGHYLEVIVQLVKLKRSKK